MAGKIYLYYGDEDYLAEEAVLKLKGSLPPGTSTEKIEGDAASLDAIQSSISMTGLFSTAKLVIVKDLFLLKAPKKSPHPEEEDVVPDVDDGASSSGDVEPLIRALSNLSDDITVAFLYCGAPDRRKKLYKFLEKNGTVSEFKPFTEWEQEKLLSWIIGEVAASGKKIGSHAASFLMETSGPSLRALVSEIGKIVTYIGEKGTIEMEDVSAVASSGRLSAFSLINSIREKDIKGSLAALSRLIRDREDPVALIGLITRQIKMLLQVKALMARGMNEYDISRELKEKPFFVRRTLESASRWSLNELKGCMETLHLSDLKLREGYSSSQTIVEAAMIEMLVPRGKAGAER